jgi:hypothetical protein
VGEVELGAVHFHIAGENPVDPAVFDFWVEMPPHGLVEGPDYLFGGPDGNRMPCEVNGLFNGLIYDYRAVAARSVSPARQRALPAHTIAGIMPGWDNTARRGYRAHIAYGGNPAHFNAWLGPFLEKRVPASYRGEMFVNAWNEWAEKAMLEPTQTFGTLYLDVLRSHVGSQPAAAPPHPAPAPKPRRKRG